MTKRLVLMAALVGAAACADEETCDTAVPAYYADGCALINQTTAMLISEEAALLSCNYDSEQVSDRCADIFQNYLDCMSKGEDPDFGCVCWEVRDGWRACEDLD